MITVIRKSFKSKAYKIILWVTILALAGIFSLPELLKRTAKAKWIASVNGQEIDYQDYMRKTAMHQELITNLRAQYGQYADIFLQSMGMSLDPAVSAKNELIQEALLNQACNAMGLVVSPEHVTEKLANPIFVQQELFGLVPAGVLDQFGGINMHILKMYLQRIGLSMHDFESRVNQTLQRALVSNMVKLASYTPEFAVKEQFIAQYIKKKFSILALPFAMMVKQERTKPISQEELHTFFEAQNTKSKRYWIPEKRSGIVWRLNAHDYGIKITPQEIEDFYEENKVKNYLKEPSKVQVRQIIFKVASEAQRPAVYEKARKIRDELMQSPSKFEELARTVSEDKESASKGGLIEAFARGQKERDFDKAAFILKADGDISDIVQTKEGYAIIQRVSKTPATFKPISDVEKEIVIQLTQLKFSQIFTKDMQQLTEQTKGIKGKLAEELKAKGGKSSALDGITRDSKEWGNTLFGLMQVNDVSYYVENAIGHVVQLNKIEEQYLPTLQTIKDVVENDIYEERASHSMQKKVHEIQQQAAKVPLRELQVTHGGNIERTDWLSKEDTEALTNLKKKGIPVEQLFQLEKVGAVNTFSEGKDSYIMRLDEIQEFKPEEYKAKKDEIRKELINQEMRLYLAGFVASLYRSATIKQNESLANLTEEEIPYYEE